MRGVRDRRFGIIAPWERTSWKGIHKGEGVHCHLSALGQHLMRKPKRRFPSRMASFGQPLLEWGLLRIVALAFERRLRMLGSS
jgi:hypothetical protein